MEGEPGWAGDRLESGSYRKVWSSILPAFRQFLTTYLCVQQMATSLKRGEAPIASHLLYTQPGILNDDIPDQRLLSI